MRPLPPWYALSDCPGCAAGLRRNVQKMLRAWFFTFCKYRTVFWGVQIYPVAIGKKEHGLCSQFKKYHPSHFVLPYLSPCSRFPTSVNIQSRKASSPRSLPDFIPVCEWFMYFGRCIPADTNYFQVDHWGVRKGWGLRSAYICRITLICPSPVSLGKNIYLIIISFPSNEPEWLNGRAHH